MDNPRHIVVVGCLIRNGNDEVLLVRHHKRGWEMPQGRVEEGEGLLAALHREVREETGVEVEAGHLAAIWSKTSAPAALIFGFLGRYRGGELLPNEECPELGWFAAPEACVLVTHPVNRERLETLLGFSGQTVYRTYASHPYQVLEEAVLAGKE